MARPWCWDIIYFNEKMAKWWNFGRPNRCFLSALRAKGATGTELSSMAEVLLNACKLPVERPNLFMVDTCGTGDGANTFNISTAVAFVASSCGVNIAKHGNKSASGKVGSADVLLNLGLNLNCSLEKVIKAVSEIGITFCSHLFGINL